MKDACMSETNLKNSEGFIGKVEVARRIGKTVRTVDEWMKRGILPYYKPDRSVLFRWADVEQHIIANYLVKRAKPNGVRCKMRRAVVQQAGSSS
jgi:excisionase family DNA binding protein